MRTSIDIDNAILCEAKKFALDSHKSFGSIVEDALRVMLVKKNSKEKFIPDAYHAALAIESGCEWVTTDKGFKKFKGLKLKILSNDDFK